MKAMKTNLFKTIIVLLVAGQQRIYSQGTFSNLDFESVIPPLIVGFNNRVPTANALPGWTDYYGGIKYGSVYYNTQPLDQTSGAIGLHSSFTPYPSFLPIQGNYSF